MCKCVVCVPFFPPVYLGENFFFGPKFGVKKVGTFFFRSKTAEFFKQKKNFLEKFFWGIVFWKNFGVAEWRKISGVGTKNRSDSPALIERVGRSHSAHSAER